MEFLAKLTFALRSIGWRAVLRTIPGAIRRDRYDRQVTQIDARGANLLPGMFVDLVLGDRGARLRFEQRSLELDFLAPDLVRLNWLPGLPPLPYALAEDHWPAVEVNYRDHEGQHIFSTSHLTVRVNCDGSLTFATPQGDLLRSDQAPLFAEPGEKGACRLVSDLRTEEFIHGLGQRAAGLNLRPGSYRFQNLEAEGSYALGDDPLYLGIPVYLGRHAGGAYLVFYENSFYGQLEVDAQLDVSFEDGQLRYYFMAGSLPHLYERYSQLTGQAPLPPRWALGYHQSRWGYKSEAQVRQVLAGFQAHNLPWSALHLDIDYMHGYRCFSVDEKRFPDLAALVTDLGQAGVKVVAINDVGLKRDAAYALYQQAYQENLLVKAPDGSVLHALVWPGWSAFPDFTNPTTRRWWGDQYSWFVERDIAGVWHDMNEPAAFVAWGQARLPLSSQYHLDGRGGDHRQANNLYGLLNDRAGFEGLQRLRPERRPWIVSRSGWAGMQRYAWHWTADIKTSWQSLRLTIAQVLNLGLSGIPYTGPDIGGFTGSPGAELFTRWFQLAAFLPFFRSHAAVGMEQQEPWAYGEPYTSIMRRFLQLRYTLMPYWYTLAWETAQQGTPLVRPIFWEYPQEAAVDSVADQFMLGPDLLVAPVLEANSQMRQVWLPPGRWYSWWRPETWYQGPGLIQVEAPLDEMPIFVRGGAILPLEDAAGLGLCLYLPAVDSALRGRVYQDAGDGDQAGRLAVYQGDWQRGVLRLESNVQGEYEPPNRALRLRWFGGQFDQALVDSVPQSCQDNSLLVNDFSQVILRLDLSSKLPGKPSD